MSTTREIAQIKLSLQDYEAFEALDANTSVLSKEESGYLRKNKQFKTEDGRAFVELSLVVPKHYCKGASDYFSKTRLEKFKEDLLMLKNHTSPESEALIQEIDHELSLKHTENQRCTANESTRYPHTYEKVYSTEDALEVTSAPLDQDEDSPYFNGNFDRSTAWLAENSDQYSIQMSQADPHHELIEYKIKINTTHYSPMSDPTEDSWPHGEWTIRIEGNQSTLIFTHEYDPNDRNSIPFRRIDGKNKVYGKITPKENGGKNYELDMGVKGKIRFGKNVDGSFTELVKLDARDRFNRVLSILSWELDRMEKDNLDSDQKKSSKLPHSAEKILQVSFTLERMRSLQKSLIDHSSDPALNMDEFIETYLCGIKPEKFPLNAEAWKRIKAELPQDQAKQIEKFLTAGHFLVNGQLRMEGLLYLEHVSRYGPIMDFQEVDKATDRIYKDVSHNLVIRSRLRSGIEGRHSSGHTFRSMHAELKKAIRKAKV